MPNTPETLSPKCGATDIPAPEPRRTESGWLVIDSGLGEPAINMALDEALLEAAPRLGRPVLRFYGWRAPAASFGYFQIYHEIERMTALRPLVRRPTAGGLVPHDADWTYSLVFPAEHPWHGLTALESYSCIHRWLKQVFALLNIETELAPCCHKSSPGQCFAGHEISDLLWQGKKIAGAAQRRTRGGQLVQGSVQPPPVASDRARWQKAFCATGPDGHPIEAEIAVPDAELLRRADQLAREKYSREEFNRKR